jgi:hypothetical protein
MATGRVSFPAIAATAVVVATVIAAVVVTGGPSAQRAIRLDERRARDLDQIVAAVNVYWVRHNALPAVLDSMVSDHQLADVPRDPMTRQPYTYAATGPKTFHLCTTFQQPTEEEDRGITRVYGKAWDHHGRGPACYDLEPHQTPGAPLR